MKAFLALVASLLLALPAAAQYPDKPVTLLAGYPPGGLLDIVARLVAEGMKPKFPRGLTVVNRPGAAGSVAVAEMARSSPDGYTIIVTPHSALVIAAQLQDLAYKTPDDYDPVINLEELMHHAGVKMIHVPFQGWGQSSPALLGGHIEALVAQPGELKGQVDGKRMRVLVAFQPQRHPVFPDVPTAKELGWDVANGVWYLLMAPKKTPPQVVRYLHDAAKAAIEDPQFAATMAARGIDVDYRPGEALRADLWREYRLHTEILRRIGMLKQLILIEAPVFGGLGSAKLPSKNVFADTTILFRKGGLK